MKLIYIHKTPITSDEANIIQVMNMCHAFAGQGVEVKLFLPVDKYLDCRIEDYIEEKFGIGVNFEIELYPRILVLNHFRFFSGLITINRLLSSEDVDICYVRNPIVAILSTTKRIPTIFECHNYVFLSKCKLINYILRRLLINITRNKYFLKLISISYSLSKEWANTQIAKDKIQTLHDGFNRILFQNRDSKYTLRSNLGLPQAHRIVTYAGSLYENRGIESILKLAAKFKADVRFVVIGGPEENKNKFRAIAKTKNLDNIMFLGRVPPRKVPEYLLASDVLLMLWSEEVKTIQYCSPLKVFEYMAAGRVIVGHGFPTIKEVLVDRQDALLVEPNNFNELSEAVKEALRENENSKLATNAKTKAFGNYTWEHRARRIIEELKKVQTS